MPVDSPTPISSNRGGVSADIPENERKEKTKRKDDSNHITPQEKREGDVPVLPTRYILPESHYITRVISDFSREFDDDPHRASNTAQALRLWGHSGLDEETFVAQLQTARKLTRRYQGRQGLGTIENKMAYFFTTLRQVLQNRAAS